MIHAFPADSVIKALLLWELQQHPTEDTWATSESGRAIRRSHGGLPQFSRIAFLSVALLPRR